jgi:hypothetical protein
MKRLFLGVAYAQEVMARPDRADITATDVL